MRYALATLAAAALLVATPVAAGNLDSWRIFHMPDDPPVGAPVRGEVIFRADVFDGTDWKLAGVVVIRPLHGPSVCGPTLGPTPSVG